MPPWSTTIACCSRFGRRFVLGYLVVALMAACDDPQNLIEPDADDPRRAPLEFLMERTVPEPLAVDVLFVVDTEQGGSALQDDLGVAVRRLTTTLFEGGYDFRFAVIDGGAGPDSPRFGRFLLAPADTRDGLDACDPPSAVGCDRVAVLQDTPVLDPSDLARRINADADLNWLTYLREATDERLQCMVSLGSTASDAGAGIAGLLYALACDGPNAEATRFRCIPGLATPGALAEAPISVTSFPRVDSVLVVVIVSARDDCSPPVQCFDGACIPPITGPACAWARDQLLSVGESVRWLDDLPGRLMMATFVGPPQFTPSGRRAVFREGVPEPDCEDRVDDACCPGGVCWGAPTPSCRMLHGTDCLERAGPQPGDRYLELASALGPDSATCGAPTELDDDAACQGRETMDSCVLQRSDGAPVTGMCIPRAGASPTPGRPPELVCRACTSACRIELYETLVPRLEQSLQDSTADCLPPVPGCDVECLRRAEADGDIVILLECDAADLDCLAALPDDGSPTIPDSRWTLRADPVCPSGLTVRIGAVLPAGTRWSAWWTPPPSPADAGPDQ